MDQVPAQASQGDQPGSASQLVVDINQKLTQLSDIVSKSSAVTPEDKSKLGQVLGGFQSFVDGLGQPAGQNPAAPQEPAPKGAPMPMHAAPGGM